jgi:hypothetical protein
VSKRRALLLGPAVVDGGRGTQLPNQLPKTGKSVTKPDNLVEFVEFMERRIPLEE